MVLLGLPAAPTSGSAAARLSLLADTTVTGPIGREVVHYVPSVSESARAHVLDLTCWCAPAVVKADRWVKIIHNAETG